MKWRRGLKKDQCVIYILLKGNGKGETSTLHFSIPKREETLYLYQTSNVYVIPLK